MSKKRVQISVVAMIFVATLILLGGTGFAAKQFFVIATGGTGGTYYPLGGVLAQALSNKLPDIIITAQASNASNSNINLLSKHEIESAFVQNNSVYYAHNGMPPFTKPIKNIRGIASLYAEAIHIVARPEANIKSLQDLKGKRVIPGDMGSGTVQDAENVLKAFNMSFKDFGQVDYLPYTGMAQRLKDKQADAAFLTTGFPSSSLLELGSNTDFTMLNMDAATIEKLTKTYPFFAEAIIPAGTYKGIDKDVHTVACMAQWVVDEKVSEEIVYNLTKALWEKGQFVLLKKGEAAQESPSGAEMMARAHEKGKDVQLKTALAGMAIPLHRGAEKYYKEKGLIK